MNFRIMNTGAYDSLATGFELVYPAVGIVSQVAFMEVNGGDSVSGEGIIVPRDARLDPFIPYQRRETGIHWEVQ